MAPLSSAQRPLSIAVIGAGPSGLFFCHAVESMQKKQQQPHDHHQQPPPTDVSVTCFERAAQPGGVWRAAKATEDTATNMYDQLWTNGASHCTEWFDYTFDEHFGRTPNVSVYMKRQDLLDYILGRVQKHSPDFLNQHVRCNTEVQHVVFNEDRQQFRVTTVSTTSNTDNNVDKNEPEVQYYDKCVWACGDNGKRKLPANIVTAFQNFHGRVIHSADTARLEEDVRGKRILLVGGGFSAEDLALQAIKLGVEKVYVSCRCNSAEICWTEHWPSDKVEVLRLQVPTGVTEEGRCIQFQEVEWSYDGYKVSSDEIETELRGVDTVILCTGYDVNLSMLDETLRSKGFPKGSKVDNATLDVPAGWKMPNNTLSELTGDVELCDKIQYYAGYVHPEFYKGVLISNPNMMYICPYASYVPLMACDAYAWLLAGYATGNLELPSQEEMRRQNEAEALMELGVPFFRYYMDRNYCDAVNNLEDFWPEDGESPEKWDEIETEEWHISMRRLAQVMQDGKYPFSLGDYNELNDNGKAFIKFGDLDYQHRANLESSDWKTFRDVDDADQFYSLHTGTKAVPLEQRWLDIGAVAAASSADSKEEKENKTGTTK